MTPLLERRALNSLEDKGSGGYCASRLKKFTNTCTDEALSAVDAENEAIIQEALDKLMKSVLH